MTEKTLQRKVIHLDEEFKKFVDAIEKDGPFEGAAHKDVFIIALVLGFNKGKRTPIKKRLSGGFFREDTFNDDQRNLIATIAIAHKENLEILMEKNKDELFSIAEEYANTGFPILREQLALSGTFEKRLESELRKKIKILNEIKL